MSHSTVAGVPHLPIRKVLFNNKHDAISQLSTMPGPAIDLAAPAHAPAAASPALAAAGAKTSHTPERKYKCQYCSRAFSRSEHRSRHERSRKFFSAQTILKEELPQDRAKLEDSSHQDYIAHPVLRYTD